MHIELSSCQPGLGLGLLTVARQQPFSCQAWAWAWRLQPMGPIVASLTKTTERWERLGQVNKGDEKLDLLCCDMNRYLLCCAY